MISGWTPSLTLIEPIAGPCTSRGEVCISRNLETSSIIGSTSLKSGRFDGSSDQQRAISRSSAYGALVGTGSRIPSRATYE